MKKNIGSQLALYPPPVTVIGAMNGDQPTWTLVAHVGIMGHDRVLVSPAAAHFINEIIKTNQKLSINLVDEAMLPEADYAGSVSGGKVNKSALFEYESGDAGTPIIGVTKPEQVEDAAKAAHIKLSGDEVARLEQLATDSGVDTRGSWEKPMV